MREKLATLPLTQLKELAKSQGIKNISGLRKAELIDRLCETAKARAQEAPAEAASVPECGSRECRDRETVCSTGAHGTSGTWSSSGENRPI